ncbi:ATP/GTP-binding protein [Streptomyces lasiicapitis]|uniref:ATP/GTP-binding protein n=1 Tax=Streptomyces lasiicapitis TaxID=1923961 RepID=A0ABQ2MW56_9ACTN|nr:ATP/GTP-binding protein [Streptomyces lasiicapitis]GGO59002.1 ATP/GTP-binding protein [Streptomyces lasiicapitis]
MLRRAALAAAILVAGVAPVAYADGKKSSGLCDGAVMWVKVCAEEPGREPGTGGGGGGGGAQSSAKGGKSGPKCTYTKAKPQPPANNLAMKDGKRRGGKGAVYRVTCPSTGRVGVVWIPDAAGAPDVPAIDPEVVAQRAVDQMKLAGPDIASPRAAGKYVVGVPMWLWVRKTPTTFGPNTATATAGGVTVTATAKVKKIVWRMGDGGTQTCAGPGTPYKESYGMKESPTCGHRYTKTSAKAAGGKFALTATSTWSIDWQVTGGGGEAGELTEVRQSQAQVAVGEVQVVG